MAAAAPLLFTGSCNKPFEFDRPLAISSRAVTLEQTAGSTHVMVYSEGAWTASLTEAVKWASLSKLSGEGINDVVFNYSANYGVSRQVGIVFTSGAVRDTVMMTQKGAITEASFLFDNSALTLLRSEAVVKVPFKTNITYGLDCVKTSVTYAEEMVGEGEEVPENFERWISDVTVGKKSTTFKVDENESGEPRVAYIRFEIFDPAQSTGSPVNATLVVTQSASDPELSFSVTEMDLEGYPADLLFESLANNIWPYSGEVEIECEAEWVSKISLTKEGLNLTISRNDDDGPRTAEVKLSYTDGLGNTVAATLKVTQAPFPQPMSFEDVRAMAVAGKETVLNDFKCIEGYIISDPTSKNIISSPQTGQFAFDKDLNDRIAYFQPKDGRLGMRLTFTDAKAAAAIPRFSKVSILLQGLTIGVEPDPARYNLSGITSEHIITQEEGDMTSVAVKRKRISDLTDDDIYTYVNIIDAEIMCKDGAYTNCTDGYSFKETANPESGNASAPRWDVAPLLVTDTQGNTIFMLTNASCTWRRGAKDMAFNTIVPQGSGVFKAIVVHEEQPTVRHGNLGRYQLRHMSPDDLAFNSPAFSNTIVEWNWNDRKVDLVPEIGSGSLNLLSGTAHVGASDFNNTYNGRKSDGGNGGSTGNQKGLVINAGIKFNNHWWDFEKNEGRYFDISFSTAGISGTNMVFGIVWGHGAMGSTTLDSPAHWKLLYSVDGGVNFQDVPDCEIIKNRSIVWWTTTSQDSCPGFTEHLRKLPQDCFGKENVVLRLQVADKVTDIDPKPKTVKDDSYKNFLGIEKGTLTDKDTEIRIGTITVRYN